LVSFAEPKYFQTRFKIYFSENSSKSDDDNSYVKVMMIIHMWS